MDRLPNAASVALLYGQKVLLIQRARPPYFGLWTLPGGRLEVGETAEQAARREVREELGLEVHRLQPLMRLALGGAGDFLLQTFATEAFEGTIALSEEVVAYQWVRPDRLGQLPVTPHLFAVIERAVRLFDRS